MINIIITISKNRVIGKNNLIPWHIPEDLKYFKEQTSGKKSALIMGSNTWKSLPTYPEPLQIEFLGLFKNNIYENTRANIMADLENFENNRLKNMY